MNRIRPERMGAMELVPTRKLHLLTGRTHPALAAEIAANLGLELGEPNLVDFANGEVRPRFADGGHQSDFQPQYRYPRGKRLAVDRRGGIHPTD